MNFGDIQHDLLFVKNLNKTVRKPTDVGIFDSKKQKKLNSLLKGVSI